MSFVKQSVFRSCFGTQKHYGGIGLDTDIFLPDTNMYDFHIEGIAAEQKKGRLILENKTAGQGTASCRIAAYPGPCLVELSLEECLQGVCILRIGALSFEYDGRRLAVCAKDTLALEPGKLLLHFNGSLVSVCTKTDTVHYAGTFDLTEYEDLRVCRRDRVFWLDFRIDGGGKIILGGADVYMTGGTGQADFRIISYEDGTPIVERGRVYLAATCRGYQQIPCSCQGVYSMPAEGGDLAVEGIITFDRGDNIARHWHASQIYFDRRLDRWCCVTVSHGDDHGLYYAAASKDIRFGYSTLSALPLAYDRQGNEEDAYMLRAGDTVYMIYVKADERGYRLVLAKGQSIDGVFEDIASVDKVSFTGPILLNIGGRLTAAAGRGTDNFEIYTGEELREGGILELDSMPHARNIWPCIWPFDDGRSRRAALLTFDRGKLTGNYSYGACYLYHSTEEFDAFCAKK